jgi:hypothetical protein
VPLPERAAGDLPVIGRPPGIPPLVEEVPVRFSPVPVPPVPRWDDVPEEPAAEELAPPVLDPTLDTTFDTASATTSDPTSAAAFDAPAAVEPEEPAVRFSPVEPVPEVAVAPAPLDEVPEYRRSLEPTFLEPTSLEPSSLKPTSLEPTSLEPTPLDEVPEYRRSLEPEPISVLAPPAEAEPAPDPDRATAAVADGLGPAPTAASVFGGQRGAELAAPVAAPDPPDAPAAPPALRFDLVDDDLLPVGRRRSRR